MMTIAMTFYLAAAIAVIASIKVITRQNAVHALLYLVVSLLAVALCFYLMGAPFAAGLEVIIYAGAILVLFVFAVMMFDLHNTPDGQNQLRAGLWFGPGMLALVLLGEMLYILSPLGGDEISHFKLVNAKEVGSMLYGPYLLAVEIASFLLLAGLIAGYHFAKADTPRRQL
jgi:NADH-quinone oxidoreductase subunit J